MSEDDRLHRHQEERLRTLLAAVLEHNEFYRAKLAPLGLDPERFPLDRLATLPFTTKTELVADQERHPPFGTNLGAEPDRFVRLHKTSGTTGRPLLWLDTADSWAWFRRCWEEILRRAGVTPADRVFVAFSFGPFIGFWSAFEAAQALGCLTLTGGALTTSERLDAILDLEATVLVSTPTYALRLAEVATERGIDLRDSAVRLGLQAGEPGASVPNVRRRLEEAWGMLCVDHAGATEVGPWGVRGPDEHDMRVLEEDFIAEVVSVGTDALASPDADGVRRGELVLTNLGRCACPVLRYRTGDIVEAREPGPGEAPGLRLRGGVLARADGMEVVRGVNVYPSAIDNLVRAFPEIGEFRATVRHGRDLARLAIEVEVPREKAAAITGSLAEAVHRQLALRAEIVAVAPGSLPRFELKARRFFVERS